MQTGVIGHCSFCSLCCPMTAEHWWAAHYWSAPETEEAGRHGLCARGGSLFSLLENPARARGGVLRREEQQTRLYGEAVVHAFQRLVEEAGRSGRMAVLLDGNLPCEDLVAAHEWAKARGDAVAAVYLPAGDFDLLDGLSAGEAVVRGAHPTGEAVVRGAHPTGEVTVRVAQPAECGAMLIVGDALSTHPALARPLLDAKYARPGRPILVMDTFASRTMRFADLALTVEPGGQEALLGALRRALAGETSAIAHVAALGHTDTKLVERALGRLASAAKPLVVVSPEPTKAEDWRGIGAAAAQLAADTFGSVLPLYSYGNALGAYRVHRNLGMPRFESLLSMRDPDWSLLVFVGWDPTLTFPVELLRPLHRRFPRIVALSPVETPAWRAADLAAAMPLLLEYSGHVVRRRKRSRASLALLLMAGVCRVRDFFDAGGAELPTAWRETPAPAPRVAPAASTAASRGFCLLAASSTLHFSDGALTRQAAATQHLSGEDALRISPAAARRLNLREGQRVSIRRDGLELSLACELDAALPAELAVAPLHRPEVRRFLPWRLDASGPRLSCVAPAVQIFPLAEEGAA
ncbi:hypothetical protein HS125_16350 [bacterium]|nr:hypothetical protein [bacterium]